MVLIYEMFHWASAQHLEIDFHAQMFPIIYAYENSVCVVLCKIGFCELDKLKGECTPGNHEIGQYLLINNN